jgi:hypothetical protein
LWSSLGELSHLFYIFRLCRITLAAFSLLKRKTLFFCFSPSTQKNNFFYVAFSLLFYFMLCRAGKVNEIFFSRARCESSSSSLLYILFFSTSHFTFRFMSISAQNEKKKRWKNNKRAAKKSRKFILDE